MSLPWELYNQISILFDTENDPEVLTHLLAHVSSANNKEVVEQLRSKLEGFI